MAVLAAEAALAQYAGPRGPDEPVFSYESGLGPIEYRAGRGLSVGDTGFNIGGFSTVELDRGEHGPTIVEIDAVNFLLLYRPIESFKLFADLELDGLLAAESPKWDVDSDVDFLPERLYGEIAISDRQNFRFGKFQTPVGRWNVVPAEPFVWTASSPALTDVAFDEHQTGLMFFGTTYPGELNLKYSIFGTVLDPLERDSFPPAADRSVGGRLELDSLLGDWSVGSSFIASERRGRRGRGARWNFLSGVDAVWQRGPLEFTGELVFGDGRLADRNLFGFYVQGVYELYPNLHAVARYEYFAPRGGEENSHIGDVGLSWIPVPYLYFKAGYRFADRQNPSAEIQRGLAASASVVF